MGVYPFVAMISPEEVDEHFQNLSNRDGDS